MSKLLFNAITHELRFNNTNPPPILPPSEKHVIHKNLEGETKWKISERNKATTVHSVRCGIMGKWKILSRHELLNTLLEADSATLKISNKKNETMGQTLHYKSTGSNKYVAALECRVNHILINRGTEENLLCDIWRR